MKVSVEGKVTTIIVEKDDYQRYGSYTMIGTAMKKGGLIETSLVKIMFRVRNLEECIRYGCPDEIIMPEGVPKCLIEDVLEIQRRGWEVSLHYIDSEDVVREG